MSKKVQTGCRDCKRCTNSPIADMGRSLGRGSAALMTGGLSELGFAARKKCRSCGHQVSLHGRDNTPQPIVVVQASSPTPPSAPSKRPDPGSLLKQLAELGELRKAGLLTDEEFAAAKAKLLS